MLCGSKWKLYTKVNDLLIKLCKSGFSIHIGSDSGDEEVPALAYADDIALVAPTPSALQSLLTIIDEWCVQNGISINVR